MRSPSNASRRGLGLRRSLRTVRVRLAVLFVAVFLVTGAILLALTVLLWQGRTHAVTAQPVPAGRLANPAIGIAQHSSDRTQLLLAAAIALGAMAVLSLGLGWIVAGRFLRPLRQITTTAQRISATNLHERLNLPGPDDELKELADTIDDLLGRLERSFAFERQFVANASHELRTPLAGMRTSLEVAMAKPEPAPPHVRTLAERLVRELDGMERLLESFLVLAQSQQSPLAQDTVALAELVATAIAKRADTIASLEIEIEQDGRGDATVRGSATLLSRLIENVIQNALVHNQPRGWVHVTVAAEAGQARLVVENSGPVIDPDEAAQLTRPFKRIGHERTGSDRGSGLGLAIVSSIVDAHGGTLGLEARADGGLRVTIDLPLAAHPAPHGAPS